MRVEDAEGPARPLQRGGEPDIIHHHSVVAAYALQDGEPLRQVRRAPVVDAPGAGQARLPDDGGGQLVETVPEAGHGGALARRAALRGEMEEFAADARAISAAPSAWIRAAFPWSAGWEAMGERMSRRGALMATPPT